MNYYIKKSFLKKRVTIYKMTRRYTIVKYDIRDLVSLQWSYKITVTRDLHQFNDRDRGPPGNDLITFIDGALRGLDLIAESALKTDSMSVLPSGMSACARIVLSVNSMTLVLTATV